MAHKETTKYVAKVPIGNDKYRYFYDKAEYEAYLNTKKKSDNETDKKFSIKSLLNSMADKATDSINDAYKKGEATVNNLIKTVDKNMDNVEETVRDGVNKAFSEAGKLVDKANKAINDYIYTADKDNMYDMNSATRADKIKQVEKTKEWQDIVKRKDPEYVRKNKETGETEYLIDDYILKKKHPLLDIAEDIAYGRNTDVNEITKETTAAAVKDYIKAGVHSVQLAIGVIGGVAIAKFKYQQGSYDEEMAEIESMVANGKKHLEKSMEYSNKLSELETENSIMKVINNTSINGRYDVASVDATVKKALKEHKKQK